MKRVKSLNHFSVDEFAMVVVMFGEVLHHCIEEERRTKYCTTINQQKVEELKKNKVTDCRAVDPI